MLFKRKTLLSPAILIAAVAALFTGSALVLAADCTLADHIRSANTNTSVGGCPAGTSHDVITISQDIKLSEPLPPITGTITIEGSGHTLSGDGEFRIFDVDGGNLTVKDLTLANASADSGSAIRARSGARVTISNVVFRHNTARSGGSVAARDDDVVLTVRDSEFRDNSADDGGAITVAGGSATISGSSFVSNRAARRGGALFALGGRLEVENSVFVENIARAGGGVYVGGGNATLTHITILAGAYPADYGEGVHKQFGALRLRNSIIAGNWEASSDCSGDLDEASGNLIKDWTCGAETGGDPKLGYRGNMAPLDGSPALDAGDRRYCLPSDKNGVKRPHGGGCDIGAFESTTAIPAPTPLPVCTLADHIRSANTNTAVGACPAGTSHDVITLTEDHTLKAALPPITGTITIEGGGHTISGDRKNRIFQVDGGRLTINNLNLVNGFSHQRGGAILTSRGELTVNSARFFGNSAESGGAIATLVGNRNLIINNTRFEKNRAAAYGGALHVLSGQATVTKSSFIDNGAGSIGGAIYFDAHHEAASVSNSTFSGNRALSGGAVAARNLKTALTHVTMLNNFGNTGHDVYVSDLQAVDFNIYNSILSGRSFGAACQGRVNGNRGNLIADGSCAPAINGDPMLSEATGSPAYFELLDGSPALDAADPQYCLDTDQLGAPRPHGAGCDIGAIESTTAQPAPPPVVPPPPCPLAQQIIAANTDAAAGACPAGSGHDVINLTRDLILIQALPPITSEITIEGHGHTLSGKGSFRILDVDGGALTIRNLTLAEGNASYGGAIRLRNGAKVSARNVRFYDNQATVGGAIATLSDDVWPDVDGSSFIGNWATDYGGALLAGGGAITVANSSFQGNAAGKYGGALEGGRGRVDISNSTLTGNEANEGGGIHISGAYTTLTHLTLMENRARQIAGAGIFKRGGYALLRNSIVAGSGSGDDCFGVLDESRGNFSADGTCATPAGGDPQLGEPVGSPAYFPLREASPAHGAADPAFCLPTDQLGNPRTRCDIGAIESARAGSNAIAQNAALPDDCTLADQIIAANTDAPAGACPAGQGANTITLRENIILDAPLPPIASDVTINGKGYSIDGDNRFRVFEVLGANVVFKNLRLTNGNSPGADGGAIYAHSASEILISNMTFTNNSARSGGAVAVLGGKVGIYNSRFTDNSADERGGAIWFDAACHNTGNLEFEGNRSPTRLPYRDGIDERDTPSGCGGSAGIIARDR
ncbi:MAG: hypothetical protein F4X02_04060 [Chloroflexi bacterium]|nr:hypothetical protein [Chloroflexota bacterium]